MIGLAGKGVEIDDVREVNPLKLRRVEAGMKKWSWIAGGVVALLLCTSLAMVVLASYRHSSAVSVVTRNFGITPPGGSILHRYDDSIGTLNFLGDGEIFIQFEIPAQERTQWMQNIQNQGGWASMPLQFDPLLNHQRPLPAYQMGMLFTGRGYNTVSGQPAVTTNMTPYADYAVAIYDPLTGMLYCYESHM